MRLQKDLREFIGLLNSHRVEFLIVGGYALAFHGHPRFTGDIDLFVGVSAGNAQRLEAALREFGFAPLGLKAADFTEPGKVVQLGLPPNRIDLLTGISGVEFADAWGARVTSEIDGLPVEYISREDLIKNKRAAGRAQDKADLESLEL